MGIEELGKLIIDILTKTGYFVCTAVVIKDILSSIAKHNKEGIVEAVLTGVIGYGSILLVDNILSLVKKAVG
jgi:pyridoxal/pyridoxine/pyridoxamine kinase